MTTPNPILEALRRAEEENRAPEKSPALQLAEAENEQGDGILGRIGGALKGAGQFVGQAVLDQPEVAKTLEGLGIFQRHVADPVTATALSLPQVPSALGAAGVPGFNEEFHGFRPELVPGVGEDFRGALAEEPLGTRIATEVVTDPLNLIPGVGLTKLPRIAARQAATRTAQAARPGLRQAARLPAITRPPPVGTVAPRRPPTVFGPVTAPPGQETARSLLETTQQMSFGRAERAEIVQRISKTILQSEGDTPLLTSRAIGGEWLIEASGPGSGPEQLSKFGLEFAADKAGRTISPVTGKSVTARNVYRLIDETRYSGGTPLPASPLGPSSTEFRPGPLEFPDELAGVSDISSKVPTKRVDKLNRDITTLQAERVKLQGIQQGLLDEFREVAQRTPVGEVGDSPLRVALSAAASRQLVIEDEILAARRALRKLPTEQDRVGPAVAQVDTPAFDRQLQVAGGKSPLTLTPPQITGPGAPSLLDLAKAPFQEVRNDIRGALAARPPAPRDVIQRVQAMTVNDWLGMGAKAGVETLNALKTVWSSIDISFLLRQGGILSTGHPRTAGRLLGQSIRAIMSPDEFRRYDDFIRNDPDFVRLATQRSVANPDGAKTPIKLFESGGDLTVRDEAYMSSLLQRLPVLGIPFRASERGFHTFLNGLRFRVAKQEIASAANRGNVVDDSLIDGMNNLVNKTTGVGSLGPANAMAPFLNIPFWSPRLLLSRPQTVLLLAERNPAVRKLIAKDLAAWIGMGFLTLGLTGYGLEKSSVEFNPLSSDFAKLRVGPQRFDPWAGFQPLVRYLAQMSTGERKVLDTGEIQDIGRAKTAWRFTRSKFSPGIGSILDFATGKDFIGREVPDPDARKQAFESLAPLIARDVEEGLREAGIWGAITSGTGAAVGFGTSAFPTSAERRQRGP